MKRDTGTGLAEGEMTSFQWLAVGICVMLVMLDGFDVLVMAFTASSVAAEWQLNGAQLGFLFSAGLVGMAIGSLFLAPLADRWGRQAIILVCLVIITVGMALSALARSSIELGLLRALTGLGIGGMLASVGVITAEFASDKWRSTAVSLQATGYPIGATIGGTIAAVLLDLHGWRSVFVFGSLATALMIPVVLWRLPESLDFLLNRQPRGALKKANALLRQMHRPQLAQLPPRAAKLAGAPSTGVAGLFDARLRGATLLLWGAFFLLMFSFYFALSWTPKLLVSAGLSATQGVTGGVLLNVGGIAGGGIFGVLAARFGLRPLTASALVLTALALVVFGLCTDQLSAAFAAASAIGAFIFASMAGLYAFAPVIYPAAVRTTGLGWAIGVGRLGAVLGPFVAGLLLDRNWPAPHLYFIYALPLVAAAAAVLAMGRRGGVHAPSAAVASAH
ncbi:MFS transporter [Variovorax ginsengisoli]|uniref:MFS transporter n=1 Tax=Variovorax ginsengisoli TaxID=363844 RepID=A0ABT8S1Q7_9BURK|nr:MFS transporter [Variovorax ginsengisoli]MDN8613590.1 MFS transporter [Variovorax ginsengisoli]MDO1532760.1 MFS transporter [Variovorax ginsengisoli]